MTVFCCKGHKRRKLLFVWYIVNTICKRHFFFVHFYLRHEFCNRFIGKEHKLFYQLVGFFAFLYNNTNWFSFFIKLKAHICGGKVDRSFFKSLCSEVLSKVI